ncbi:hypothetical protein BGW39_006258 [Mortierella sp. 14UC]|nr:hypothetical protein BGW39_006258 [Mortierella sp. 14UC]
MTPHQQFRHGDIVESLAVRKDKITGQFYSRLVDIQETFPDALRFKVNGVVLNFLEDENEQRYEPKRIAHHPEDIIDIVTTTTTNVPLSPSVSLSNLSDKGYHQRNPSTLSRQTQHSVNSSIDYGVSTLSLRHRTTTSNNFVCLPGSVSTLAVSNPLIGNLVATLSSNTTGISNLEQQVAQLSDTGSAQHLQLMGEIAQMMRRQNKLLEKQNEMLKEQAESKEREEKMLRMQQETIDRLIVTQQRVDAILVQNYELHEYPIPRLFVIMPEPASKWDPSTLVVKKYRLHFLCECGEHPKPDSSQVALPGVAPGRDISVKNRVHLTNHRGYELSRPKEFFDRYGPFVLGMLRILKHCLTVASVVAPAVALVDDAMKDVMDNTKSLAENTMNAVDVSIGFLETRLGDKSTEDPGQNDETLGQRDDGMLQDLAALEGADLRRLDTFLRNNDADKVLGDLYRITTETGHVKWVCFEHYKETYRQTALELFTQSVEAAGGAYDPYFRKVTISLTSATSAKDFFKRLVKQAPTVDQLDISIDWKFGSSDLVMIVEMLALSNVRSFSLDLKDLEAGNTKLAALLPGKGRYHSLLGLLSNTKLRQLSFTNILQLGTRTSALPSSHRPSLLQSFHFLQEMTEGDNPRLVNILQHCTGLVDLRLGSPRSENNIGFAMHHFISSMKSLQTLHLYRSIQYLVSILPGLNLIYFGAGLYIKELLKHVNIRPLKSLSTFNSTVFLNIFLLSDST